MTSGGKGDPYYGRPLREFGLVRHCAQCGAEFVIRGEHHYLLLAALLVSRPRSPSPGPPTCTSA
jgi:hypothetical protein